MNAFSMIKEIADTLRCMKRCTPRTNISAEMANLFRLKKVKHMIGLKV